MEGWTALQSPAHWSSAATARPGSSPHRIGCSRLHQPGELTPVGIHDGYLYVITESSKVRSKLVYDRPTPNSRLTFCNLTELPSSERLHNEMWLHRFDVISLDLSCLGAIIRKYTIGFVSAYACSL